MGSIGIVPANQQDMAISSYTTALEALSSLITRRKRGDGSKRVEKFDLMFKYLKVLELDKHIDKLQIIHVAGTKGKGSTCTFCEAILRESGFRTGLFTSPHLIDVRERYRINGSDISEIDFLHYFWDCWNQLKEKIVEDLPMPPLFQFLTLLAFKIFLSKKVDVAILEVGLGGRLDFTNVVKEPVVCGITSLGMDHMDILGDTIGKIADEKAGIFKPHVPAFTASQLPEAMFVLQDRASELMVPLQVVQSLDSEILKGWKLGLAGDHQFINAGLAVALCKCWIQRTGHSNVFRNDDLEVQLPEAFLKGLSAASLPGRAQIIIDRPQAFCKTSGELTFYLDGAHSPESIEVCARWFSGAVTDGQHSSEISTHNNIKEENGHCNRFRKTTKKILLFNCMEERDPHHILPQLINICSTHGVYFSRALFVPTLSSYHKVDSATSLVSSDTSVDISWQLTLQRTWEKLIRGKEVTFGNDPKFEKPGNLLHTNDDPLEKCSSASEQVCSSVIPSLPLAVNWLRDYAKDNSSIRLQVLVTGSLHLVGDVLKLLRR